MFTGQDITEVFYQLVGAFMVGKTEDSVRGSKFWYISPIVVHIENPKRRCYHIPGRNNNLVATIAETLWVIAGKDDIAYLQRYLPRAITFSDDGKTWRGAYGKRIRDWYGVDQLRHVLKSLRETPMTSRAIINIFDPQIDSSLDVIDVPCNNWLQFYIQDNKLSLNVTLRANDLFWGFSGINCFEWTILQELVASWLKIPVGSYYHFVGDMVIFERHFERAIKIFQSPKKSIYSEENAIQFTEVDIEEQKFDEELSIFFSIEEKFARNECTVAEFLVEIFAISSVFLRQSLVLMVCFLCLKKEDIAGFLKIYESARNDIYKLSATNYLLLVAKKTMPAQSFDQLKSSIISGFPQVANYCEV